MRLAKPDVMRINKLTLATLIGSMSISVAAQTNPTPASDTSQWVQQSDWPRDLYTTSIEGSVTADISVDTEGKPTACRIAQSSGYDAMDNVVCSRLMQRGEFKPATDDRGRSIEGLYTTTVAFRFNDSLPQIPEPGDLIMSFVIDKDGSVTECTVDGKAPASMGKLPDCPRGIRFQPATGANGLPQRMRVKFRFQVAREPLSE